MRHEWAFVLRSEGGAHADFLREMIGFAAERLIELEVGALPAPPGER